MLPQKPKFLKRIKPKKRQEIREVNQKTMNFLFLGGLTVIIALATLSIVASLTRSNKSQTIIQEVKKEDTLINYQLQYFLNDYVKSYFTLSDDSSTKSEQIEKLNGFYNVVPETKNQGQVRSTTELISAKILMIEKDIATYQVTYTTGKEKDKQEITTGFAVPFGEKDGAYFISGLPWYVRLTDTKAIGFDSSDSVTLVDDTETDQKTKEKRDEFLTLFFTNYTSNQENLDLIADDLLALENTTFKSLDYSYYTKDGKTITAYAQVTFEIAGNTHSENFTLTLRKKDQSYYVQRLSHTISKDYAQSHTENTGETK